MRSDAALGHASVHTDALLFVLGDVAPESQAAFDDWYSYQQVQRLLAVPGFRTAARFRAVDGKSPLFNHIYDLANVDVLERSDYLDIRAGEARAGSTAAAMNHKLVNQVRGVYRRLQTTQLAQKLDPVSVRWELVTGLEVSPAFEKEMSTWYQTIHVPAVTKIPGIVRARQFAIHRQASRTYGSPPSYLIMLDLENPNTPESEEWRTLIEKPWNQRMAGFGRIVLRKTFVRIYPP